MASAKLHVGEFGDEVARLHESLSKRGFAVSPEEIKRKFFGPATREAVIEIQKRLGLDATGTIDQKTAAALSVTGPTSSLDPGPKTPPSGGSINTGTTGPISGGTINLGPRHNAATENLTKVANASSN